MKFFARRAAIPPPPLSFGEWLFRRVCDDNDPAGVPFARLEQLCSNAGSLLCGAVFARRQRFRDRLALDVPTQNEAALLARRTADGFRASLSDRSHTVLAWPWDHLATRVAWQATQAESVHPAYLGLALERIGATYATMHREQLASAFELWERVVAGLPQAPATPGLPALGEQLLTAFEAESALETARS